MTSQFDPNHMREAIRLSREWTSDGRGGPFGAVLVKDGRIIARGSNQVVPSRDPTAHAEVVAIRRACELLGTHLLEGCQLYTSCEPCPMCLAAIYWAHIDKVWFACTHADASKAGFDDTLIYEEITRPFHERRLPMFQQMRDPAEEVFEEWRASTVKSPY